MSRSLILALTLLCGCGGPAVSLQPSTVASVRTLAAAMLREAEPGKTVQIVPTEAEIRQVSAWRNPWAATHAVTMDVMIDGERQERELFVADGHLVHISDPQTKPAAQTNL